MDTLHCISTRHSCRNYNGKQIDNKCIDLILDSAIAAPSGKNGQPWRFKIVKDKSLIDDIAALSIYKKWMREAPCFICVFLDKNSSYHYMKDVQSCGASIQNILLAAHSLGIQSCWVGEILAKSESVLELMNLDPGRYELMAVIVLGYSEEDTNKIIRKDKNKFIL